MRCKLEQGQLALLHSIVRGNRAAVAARGKDVTAVGHVLVHQLHITIEPCAARGLTIGHGVGQVDAMGQHMVCTKYCNRLLLGLCQTFQTHQAVDIAALSRIGCVHVVGVQLGIRHDDCMVTIETGVTTLQVVVKTTNTIVHATAHPVVTHVQVIKGACLDSRQLSLSRGRAQILAAENAVVCGSGSSQNSVQTGSSLFSCRLSLPCCICACLRCSNQLLPCSAALIRKVCHFGAAVLANGVGHIRAGDDYAITNALEGHLTLARDCGHNSRDVCHVVGEQRCRRRDLLVRGVPVGADGQVCPLITGRDTQSINALVALIAHVQGAAAICQLCLTILRKDQIQFSH